MLSFFHRNKKNKGVAIAENEIEKEDEKQQKINIKTIIDIMKSGNLIGLNIKNEDSVDAMRRVLDLNNAKITLSEWAEWTLSIYIYDGETDLLVYENPGLKVDWDNSEVSMENGFSDYSLQIEWLVNGEWCNYITEKIEQFKINLDNKRKEIKDKEKNDEIMKIRQATQEINRKQVKFDKLFAEYNKQYSKGK